MITAVLLSTALVYLGITLLRIMSPWGFLVMVPAGLLAFQTLWWLLNPFAEVFEDRIEVRQSFLHRKSWYFKDVVKAGMGPDGKTYLVYNDGDIDKVNLFGIRKSHRSLFKSLFTREPV